MPKLKMPPGLGAEGKRTWSALLADLPGGWELSAREREQIALACQQADAIADLERELAAGGLTVEGASGQPRLNALVPELRQARLALSRLLGAVEMPDADGEPATLAGKRGKAAADKRWSRRERARAAAAN